ncbi:hypothetical protein [Paracoccus sp. NSM]|uniref:hypothetical protein n=1 Tax=Paracoccus sp. NSM TaxID=3457784 RepID=UPI00403718CE
MSVPTPAEFIAALRQRHSDPTLSDMQRLLDLIRSGDVIAAPTDDLRAALEPFAKACAQVDTKGHPDTAGFIGAGLTLGDLRCARAALSKGGDA